MRHRLYGKHLGRNTDERKNLFKGLVYSLFSFGTIQTSTTKAKAIKPLVDKIITLAKNKKPELEMYLSDKKLRDRFIQDILPKLENRSSGYTSIVRVGTRSGDQTMMVKMSLIGAERLSVIGSRLSDKSKPVVSKSVTDSSTDKQKTGKLKSDNRPQKTDNRKSKRSASRSKK